MAGIVKEPSATSTKLQERKTLSLDLNKIIEFWCLPLAVCAPVHAPSCYGPSHSELVHPWYWRSRVSSEQRQFHSGEINLKMTLKRCWRQFPGTSWTLRWSVWRQTWLGWSWRGPGRENETASLLAPTGTQEMLIFVHPYVRTVLHCQDLSIFIFLAQIHFMNTQRALKKLSDH